MRSFTLLILLLSGISLSAQDLTGIWRGTFQSSDGISNLLNSDDKYKYEIQLNQHNKKFDGVTYSYKTTVFYGKAIANGSVNPATGKVMLQEMKLVEVKMQQSSFACVQTFFMQYAKNGNVETLEGKYTSFRQDDSSICDRGTVSLVRVTNSDFYKEPFLAKREAEKKTQGAAKAPETATARKTGPPTTSAKPKTPVRPVPKDLTKKSSPKAKVSEVPKVTVKPKPSPPVATNSHAHSKTTTSAHSKNENTPPVTRIESKPITESAITALPNKDSSKTNLSITKRVPALAIPKVLTSRENELIQTLVVKSPNVLINIYDNGTIDHDTVSVYLDNKLVLSRKMLTTTPLTLKFEFKDEDELHEVILVAENLGDFPPNTSLMVVKAGDQEFEVRISSTEQKNAKVKFKYERPK
ncbi:MAG: hypothetical protein ABI151_09315 [Chitinophagaceae bacterium]